MGNETICALIATYNEKENIVGMIEAILALPENISVMVVDDNSPDGTADEIKNCFENNPRVRVLVREHDRGYGKSMAEGFKTLLQNGVSQIVTLDADWSHDPLAIPDLLAGLNDHSMAIGSRYKGGVRVLNWGLHRLALSLIANKYAQFILSVNITDCTSGCRAYRREVLELIDMNKIKSTGYAFLLEILYQIKKNEFSIVEVPIVYTERREGQSKMSKRVIWESIWAPWKFRLTTRKTR